MKLQIERAQALLSQKKTNPKKAVKVLRPLSKRNDAPWPVFHYMGVANLQMGKYEDALDFLLQAGRKGSSEAETYHLLSVCYFQLEKFDIAKKYAVKALNKRDNFFDAWLNLGSVCRAQSQLHEALASYQKANKLDPAHAGVAYRIASIYNDQGDLDKALELFEITLKIDPDYHKALVEKAGILEKKQRFEEAEECLASALKKNRRYLGARVAMAELYKNLGRYTEAVTLYREIISEYPDTGGFRVNYALCLQELGFFDESEENYQIALKDDPSGHEPLSNYLMGLHYNPKRTREEIFDAHLLWDKKFAPTERPDRPVPFNKDVNKRLRVGFISGGFRRHPVGWMITQGLEHLPKDEFEIYCYTTNNIFDALTERIHETSDVWRSLIGYNDEIAANIIRDDQIDILVELSGHAADNRLKTVVLEPSPVIVKWVGGLFNTTGLKSVDFLLTDWHETPAGEEKYYTEKLVRMPDDYICFLPPEYAPEVAPLPSNVKGFITFGCFNNPAKINNDLLDQWASIMNLVPESRLYLKSKQYGEKQFTDRIVGRMESQGIDGERLLFEAQSPHNELLEAYSQVDIALDPWPYSGGLSTCEALWMGVPVITLPGPTFAGRHSASHLINAGFAEWVSENREDYIEKAVKLAEDQEKLARLRKGMRDQVENSPLCDGEFFGAHLASAFREMWKQRAEGYQNNTADWQDHIDVKPVSNFGITGGRSSSKDIASSSHCANGSGIFSSSGDSKYVECFDKKMTVPKFSANGSRPEQKNGKLYNVHDNGAVMVLNGDHQSSSKNSSGLTIGGRNSISDEIIKSEIFRITTQNDVTVCTPDDLNLLTPYVLLEQGKWVEAELEFAIKYLQPGMSAVDAGAAFGAFTLPMAKKVGSEGRIYAFEPGSLARRFLEISKLENGFEHLEISGRGLSDKQGKCWLKLETSPEMNRIDAEGDEEVSLTTLDDWWKFQGNPVIDLLKIDVNGWESKVINGARHLLAKTSPVILLSIDGSSQQARRLAGQLKDAGYSFFTYIPALNLLSRYELESGFDPYPINLIALKKDRQQEAEQNEWMYDESAIPEEPATDAWKTCLHAFSWANSVISGWEQKSASPDYDNYFNALNYLCSAEMIGIDTVPPAKQNLRSEKAAMMLEAAQILIRIYNDGNSSVPVAFTLVRVLNSLGKTGQAVEVMQKLMEESKLGQNMGAALPFLLPLPEQDHTTIETDFSKWLRVRAVEAWLMLRDTTGYFSGEQELKLMEVLHNNPETLAATEKRLAMALLRKGESFSISNEQPLYRETQTGSNSWFWENYYNRPVNRNENGQHQKINSDGQGNRLNHIHFIVPGKTGGAHGLHARRAKGMADEMHKYGIASSIISASDPEFLRTVMNASGRPDQAIYTGIMGYDLWLQADMNINCNIFDMQEMKVFGVLSDHPYTQFMWNRMERSARQTVFLSSCPSIATEFEEIWQKGNKVEILDRTPPSVNIDSRLAEKPLKHRSVDMLIPWGLHKFFADQRSLTSQLKPLGKKALKAGNMIYEAAMEDYESTLFELFQKYIEKVSGRKYRFSNPKTEEDYLWLRVLSITDWTVRKNRRFRMLKSLVNIPDSKRVVVTALPQLAGFIPGLKAKENIEWIGEVGTAELDRLYADSKVVFVCNPTFPDMVHERVRNSMAWGCCVLSDYSPGLKKYFGDGEAIFFTKNDGSLIADVFNHSPEELQRVADAGRNRIESDFTQADYSKRLLKIMDENR